MNEKDEKGVVKLSNRHEMPTPFHKLDPTAKKEWDRVAPRLFSMGRLQRQEGFSLELYCIEYGHFADWSNELARVDATDDEKKLKQRRSMIRLMRKSVADSALGFGFRLDDQGRMNLDKPMPLNTAAAIIDRRREAEKKRINRDLDPSLPEWLAVPDTLDKHGQKEWKRVAPALYAKNRLRSADDSSLLYQYCSAFGFWRVYSSLSKSLRRHNHHDSGDYSKRAELHLQRCKKIAVELGSFFELRKGLNVNRIARRRKK
jgi:phage terminase small subunit